MEFLNASIGRKIPLWMKLTAFFMIVFFLQVSAHTEAQYITLHTKNASLESVLQDIKKQAAVTFIAKADLLDKAAKVTVRLDHVSLEAALQACLKDQPIAYIMVGSIITLKPAPVLVKDPGTVRGRVVDEENGQVIAGATVQIDHKTITTGADGFFTITLPEGNYMATVSFVGYGTKEVADIEVKSNQVFRLDVVLKRKNAALKEVVVRSSAKKESIAALYARQKNSSSISDGISAEQIARTPDNNAAQVLKRVSGLTIQDDKFATIRGLSDRYNTVLLNGSMLPSTEPNRRNFSFDIIPASQVDQIVVNKTAMPDLPAEFSGGLVQVITKDIPDENYANITVGSGFNTNSTGKTFLSTQRGSNDYLGYISSNRDWFNKTWNKEEYIAANRRSDFAAMAVMNQRIPNNWGLYKYSYSPVQNYQLNAGRRIKLGEQQELGITIGGIYRHEEALENDERNTFYTEEYHFRGNTYNFRSMVSGLANVSYKTGGHKLAAKLLYNHLFNNETNDYTGPILGFGFGTDLNHAYTNVTLVNDLLQRRLEGEHVITGQRIKIDWNADWITLRRDQPDTRNIVATYKPGSPPGFGSYTSIGSSDGYLGRGISLFDSRLDETRYNWAVNVTYPFSIGKLKQKLKAGYNGTYREAAFESIGLMGRKDVSGGNTNANEFQTAIYGLPDYKLLSPAFFKPGYLYYVPILNGDGYDGLQRLQAAYLMADLMVLKKLRLAGGVRMEDNRMDVNSGIDTVYKKREWLPSFNIIYSLTSKFNIRAAYSKTLARPDFRERSAFAYFEFKERTMYYGAQGLNDSHIQNADVRVEYYPSAGEIFSFSLFYKKFNNPVEVIGVGGNSGPITYYFNLLSSESKGLEFDFRKSLDFISPEAGPWKNIYVAGNASWMKSNVRYNSTALMNAASGIGAPDAGNTPDSRNRPLQGLSPYVINGSIGYNGSLAGVTVSYNRYGRRIVAGGYYPFEDLYENPRDVLDVQLNARFFRKRLQVRLNISDLLQQPFILYHNFSATANDNPDKFVNNRNNDPKGLAYNADLDYVRYQSFRGRNASLSFTYNF